MRSVFDIIFNRNFIFLSTWFLIIILLEQVTTKYSHANQLPGQLVSTQITKQGNYL